MKRVSFISSYRGQCDYRVAGRSDRLRSFCVGGEVTPWCWHYTYVAANEEDAELLREYIEEEFADTDRISHDVIVDYELWHTGYYGTRPNPPAGQFYDENLVEKVREAVLGRGMVSTWI